MVNCTSRHAITSTNYDGVGFQVQEKDLKKKKKKNNICINAFCYENKLTFPIYLSDQKCQNSMDWFLVTDENKLHYVSIKDFDRIK